MLNYHKYLYINEKYEYFFMNIPVNFHLIKWQTNTATLIRAAYSLRATSKIQIIKGNF